MQEAFGGILNIVFIGIFLVLVSSILAFTVNYSKAFRMKNIAISYLERYEASNCNTHASDNCPCFTPGKACYNKIAEAAGHIGYAPANINCPVNYKKASYDSGDMFCYRQVASDNNDNYMSDSPGYFEIVTQVDIDIPLVNKIMGLHFFQVTGDTRVIDG